MMNNINDKSLMKKMAMELRNQGRDAREKRAYEDDFV